MDKVPSETPVIPQRTSVSAPGAEEKISVATSNETEVESQDIWMVTEEYYLF